MAHMPTRRSPVNRRRTSLKAPQLYLPMTTNPDPQPPAEAPRMIRDSF